MGSKQKISPNIIEAIIIASIIAFCFPNFFIVMTRDFWNWFSGLDEKWFTLFTGFMAVGAAWLTIKTQTNIFQKQIKIEKDKPHYEAYLGRLSSAKQLNIRIQEVRSEINILFELEQTSDDTSFISWFSILKRDLFLCKKWPEGFRELNNLSTQIESIKNNIDEIVSYDVSLKQYVESYRYLIIQRKNFIEARLRRAESILDIEIRSIEIKLSEIMDC